jgi:hypothetical protein
MKRATKHMEPLAIAAGIHLASLVVLLPGAVLDPGPRRASPKARWPRCWCWVW